MTILNLELYIMIVNRNIFNTIYVYGKEKMCNIFLLYLNTKIGRVSDRYNVHLKKC